MSCVHMLAHTPTGVHWWHLTPSGFPTQNCHPPAYLGPYRQPKSSHAQVSCRIWCGIGAQPAHILLQTLSHLYSTYAWYNVTAMEIVILNHWGYNNKVKVSMFHTHAPFFSNTVDSKLNKFMGVKPTGQRLSHPLFLRRRFSLFIGPARYS